MFTTLAQSEFYPNFSIKFTSFLNKKNIILFYCASLKMHHFGGTIFTRYLYTFLCSLFRNMSSADGLALLGA